MTLCGRMQVEMWVSYPEPRGTVGVPWLLAVLALSLAHRSDALNASAPYGIILLSECVH